jgi:spore coat protein CotH
MTAPVPSFTAPSGTLMAGQSVSFTDTSTGSPTTWSWTFGDGGTSTIQNPTHTYATAGTFTVSLTTGNAGGTANASRVVTVKISTQVAALFPATTYAGASSQTLTVLGTGFASGATVSFRGVSRAATFVSDTHLTTTLSKEDLATAGTAAVTVTNAAPSVGTSNSMDFTLTNVVFGQTAISTPDWTASSHGKLATAAIATTLGQVFDTSQVQRMDITVGSSNWVVMQSNLAALRSKLGGSNNFSMLDDPIYVPCDVQYNGKTWYRVGLRFKGNSSLYGAGSSKLPFKLKFNEFEGVYPAITGQRFYGFKSLSLKSNFKDESEVHELVASQLYRDFGLKSSHCAFYKLYVDFGSGPVYYGLYTLVEEVDDTVLKTQYPDAGGNLYKPEEGAATFAAGSFNTFEFAKKSNENALDYSEVQALYDALNSGLRTSDPGTWKANLENILDVPIFLKWLAANNVMQNWDTYGAMPHNFYLYRNPATQRFEWIPWDNNEALASNPRCLSLGASEVSSVWPLIRYLLDDSVYAAQYRQNVHDFANNVFNADRMIPIYETQSALIQSAVLSENAGCTFTSSSKFPAAIAALRAHVAARQSAALAY